MKGKSLLELEVAKLVGAATGLEVVHGVELVSTERVEKIDLYIKGVAWYVDIDPAYYHQDSTRDERKSRRLLAEPYHRVRQIGLESLSGNVHWAQSPSALGFAEALQEPLSKAGIAWRHLSPEEVAEARGEATAEWRERGATAPTNSLAAERPDLLIEYMRNLSRAEVGPDWIIAGAKDVVLWQCERCSHEWKAPVSRRTQQLSGCPPCADSVRGLRMRVWKAWQEVWPQSTLAKDAMSTAEGRLTRRVVDLLTVAADPAAGGFMRRTYFARAVTLIEELVELSPEAITKLEAKMKELALR